MNHCPPAVLLVQRVNIRNNSRVRVDEVGKTVSISVQPNFIICSEIIIDVQVSIVVIVCVYTVTQVCFQMEHLCLSQRYLSLRHCHRLCRQV